MQIEFSKYHALSNDFIVIYGNKIGLTKIRLSHLAIQICARNEGVGADGVLYLNKRKDGVVRVAVFNADGSEAEKSGNGLRIAGLHLFRKTQKKKSFVFEMGDILCRVKIVKSTSNGAVLTTELGKPAFETKLVPVKSKEIFMINYPLNINGTKFPVTCLSLGNPHTVMFVDNFEFEWELLGADIESNKAFPNGTNVEFVKILSSKKLQLVDWERGAGPTSSSGTGAAAAVVAGVMLGVAERECEVVFETGSLNINWRTEDEVIELTGPAEFVCDGK